MARKGDSAASASAAGDTLELKGFQQDSGGVGNIQNSVNLFRGDVSLPLTLVSLPGRNGLDLSLAAVYGSHVQQSALASNLDNPTSIMGLGWALPFDAIVTQKDAVSGFGARNFLMSQGATNELTASGPYMGDGEDGLQFVVDSYEFWRIVYFPNAERWEVTKEDGVKYVFGDNSLDNNAVQVGIGYGDWIGDSALPGGQPYPVAWNLSLVQHFWGDQISFAYLDDRQPVGTSAYTRASYLARVTDVFGRTAVLNYADKDPNEYQAPHLTSGINAYQDRYETSYLASIDVSAANGEPLFSVSCDYELINLDPQQRNGFVKRCLMGVSQAMPGGQCKPGARFGYVLEAEAANAGALQSVTYPQGGVATYVYASQPVASGGALGSVLDITASTPGSTPRVWFGSDYVVVVWYSAADLALEVQVYTWGGAWFPSSTSLPLAAPLTAGSLDVVAGDNLFTVSFTDANGNFQLALFDRVDGQCGVWTNWSTESVAVGAGASPPSIVVGDWFAAAAVGTGQGQPASVNVYSRTPHAPVWTSQSIPADGVATLGAGRAYFTLFSYDPTGGQGTATLYCLDDLFQWNGPVALDSFTGLYLQTALPLFSWWNTDAYAVATYVTSAGQAVGYQVNVYSWDPGFQTTSSFNAQPFQAPSQLPQAWSLATDGLIGSLQNLLRYDGQTWQPYEFEPPSQGGLAFGYGDDLAVMSQDDGTLAAVRFDPSELQWTPVALENGSPGTALQPQISGGMLTVGPQVFVCNPGGSWTAASSGLAGANPASVFNRAPGFIAYETGSGTSAQAQVVTVVEGAPGPPTPVPTGRLLVDGATDPGTSLVGSNSLVLYPPGDGFDQAAMLTLCYILPAAIADAGEQLDYPVVGLTIDNGYQTVSTAYGYDAAAAIYDPSGAITQYPIARVYPGVVPAATPPTSFPAGYTEYCFHNSVSPALASVYASPAARQYYTMLAGQIAYSKAYDSSSNLVGAAYNGWQVYDSTDPAAPGQFVRLGQTATVTGVGQAFQLPLSNDLMAFLDGRGVAPPELLDALTGAGLPPSQNLTSASETSDTWVISDLDNQTLLVAQLDAASPPTVAFSAGLTKSSAFAYDGLSGLQTSQTGYNRRLDNSLQTVVASTTYGYQVYAGMAASHIYTAAAQTTLVADGVAASGTVTTFAETNAPGSGLWAETTTYRATVAGASYDFSAGGPQPGWLQVRSIDSRGPGGVVLESRRRDGVSTSVIWDKAFHRPVATVRNTSLSLDEAAYFGAEAYEANPGWALQPGGAQPVVDGSDRHTGSQCLRLDPQPDATLTLTLPALRPSNGNSAYLFSCWLKTRPAFDTDPGSAEWTLAASVAGGAKVTSSAPISGSGGDWRYLSALLDVSSLVSAAQPIAVTLSAANGKATEPVWIDELRFSPAVGSYGARVYDGRTFLPMATVGGNGATSCYVRDAFQDVVAQTGPDERARGFSASSFSRSGNGDVFSGADPNVQVAILADLDGRWQRFADGSEEWGAFWQAQSPADWTASNNTLVHTASEAQTLALLSPSPASDIAIQFSLAPQEMLTAPLGVRIEGVLSVRWAPAGAGPGQWELFDEASQAPITAVPAGPLFTIAASCAQALQSGDVAAVTLALAGQGVVLSAGGVTIEQAASGQGWTIFDPSANQTYGVAPAANGRLAVTRLTLAEQVWTFALHNNAVLFFADGRPLFTQQFSRPVSGALELFTANRAAFGPIVVLEGLAVQVAFSDGAGQATQAQSMEDAVGSGQVAGNNVIVTATLPDILGRPAVKTKAMRYAATPGYQPNLAQMPDWDGGAMSGDVADYYSAAGGGFSDDRGYPYLRTLFEPSPLGRIVARGNPGQDYAITQAADPSQDHVDRYAYGVNQTGDAFKDLDLYANEFAVTTVTDANGEVTYTLADKFGRTLVRRTVDPAQPSGYSSMGYDYDPMGRVIAIKPGRYYDTGDPAWLSTRVFDMLGQTSSVHDPDSGGDRKAIYATIGGVRFVQPPAGADPSDPYFLYQKFDQAGRLCETGSVSGAWDPDSLQQYADDPAWPSDGSWTTRVVWDGDLSRGDQVGLMTAVLTRNGTSAEADVIESAVYDLRGAIQQSALTVVSYDNQTYTSVFSRDNRSRLLGVTYPAAPGETPASASYVYNSLGQYVGMTGQAGAVTVQTSFAYNAAGRLDTETWSVEGATSLSRRFGYESPGWLKSLSDGIFSETISYGQTAAGEPGFYDGQAVGLSCSFNWPDAPAAFDLVFDYDPTGNLLQAASGALPDASFTAQYDSNGNMLETTEDGQTLSYAYDGSSNRLIDIGSAAGAVTYDASGSVQAVSASVRPNGLAGIAYDRVSGRANQMTVDPGLPSQTQLGFVYGGGAKRVMKSASGAAAPVKRLYLSAGGSADVVVRTMAGGSEALQTYFPSIDGLGALIDQGTVYLISKDHAGSTRALIDASGPAPVVATSYDYTAFGAPLRTTGQEGLIDYLFQGGERDPETGLNVTARVYDPYLRRFYSTDPLGQFSSPYMFAANNPVRFGDPSGLWSIGDLFHDIAGFLVSGLEIAAGAALDVVTGGGAEAAAGALIGAGVSGATYTATHIGSSFSWGDFGVQEAEGAAIGVATAGLGEFAQAMKSGVTAGADIAETAAAGQVADVAGAGGDVTQGVSGAADRSQCAFDDGSGDVKGCFAAGTLVLGEDGPVPIETIQAGDRVVAFDERSGQTTTCEVARTFRRTVSDGLVLHTSEGDLTTTAEHPFWLVGHGWLRAESLPPEGLLVARDGRRIQVQGASRLADPIEVYNFEVAPTHTYYAGEQGCLVHNMCNGEDDYDPRTAPKQRTPEELDAMADQARGLGMPLPAAASFEQISTSTDVMAIAARYAQPNAEDMAQAEIRAFQAADRARMQAMAIINQPAAAVGAGPSCLRIGAGICAGVGITVVLGGICVGIYFLSEKVSS